MTEAKVIKECPICGHTLMQYPALSRYANIDICSDCGVREAFEGFFWKEQEVDCSKFN